MKTKIAMKVTGLKPVVMLMMDTETKIRVLEVRGHPIPDKMIHEQRYRAGAAVRIMNPSTTLEQVIADLLREQAKEIKSMVREDRDRRWMELRA